MKEFIVGTCAIYKGVTFRLIIRSKNELILQGDKDDNFIDSEFKEYDQPILKGKIFKKITKDQLTSVFYSTVYCIHNDLKYTLDGSFRENDYTYRIWPHFESFERLGLNNKDDCTHYWVKENKLEKIWEEREKVAGFPFKVKKIVQIKA